ncbi:MFS transporter [Planotetraspora sp. A-T 1434]|uniref:CynX/NimT family MFS transporter n=1 Tax=Planotetraspora sp. A-T 1434 TaxID=2979219 RepID=UPI0021C20097|nr:MFS transporter [Planotetraspora sp. A-T 1434]MCT9931029.1 MFS transporter [Planotetraspora sp. A-T 1434]
MSAVARSEGSPSVAWLIAAGITLAALNLRTAVTSVGPVLDQVTAGLGMSGAAIGLLTTLPVLCFAVFGAVTPALARRMGEHRLLLGALILLGAGLALRSLVGTAEVFLAASVVALAGGAIGNVVIPTLIKRHFPRRAGTMTTVYSTALALGTMVAAAATVPIERAADGNWHVALGVWAALAAVAAIPWLALSRSEPERRNTLVQTGRGGLMRSRLAWAMAGYFGSQSIIAYVMFGWLPEVLRDHGYTSGQAGLVLAVFTGLGVPTSLVVPALSARMSDQRPLVLGFVALYAAGFAGLLTGHVLWVWSVAVSLGMGSFPLALSLLALRTRTSEATAALSAFGQSTGYLIAGAGPLVFGLLYQVSGGWALPFGLLFAAVAAQALTGWYVGAPRALEDEHHGRRRGGGHRRAVQDRGWAALESEAGHASRGVRDRITTPITGRTRARAIGARALRDGKADPVPSPRPQPARHAVRRGDRRRPAPRS